jgi:hypothetical protein
MALVRSPGTEEYWSVGKLKTFLHISEYNLLRYVALEKVRCIARAGSNVKYCVADVRACLCEEFGDERAEVKRRRPPRIKTKRLAGRAAERKTAPA